MLRGSLDDDPEGVPMRTVALMSVLLLGIATEPAFAEQQATEAEYEQVTRLGNEYERFDRTLMAIMEDALRVNDENRYECLDTLDRRLESISGRLTQLELLLGISTAMVDRRDIDVVGRYIGIAVKGMRNA